MARNRFYPGQIISPEDLHGNLSGVWTSTGNTQPFYTTCTTTAWNPKWGPEPDPPKKKPQKREAKIGKVTPKPGFMRDGDEVRSKEFKDYTTKEQITIKMSQFADWMNT